MSKTTKRKLGDNPDTGPSNMVLHKSRFALGDTVTEKLTGITGRVVGISLWETGCNHIGVKRLGVDKDGKPHDILWFDEPMVDHAEEASDATKAPNQSERPGGPLPSGASYSSPSNVSTEHY